MSKRYEDDKRKIAAFVREMSDYAKGQDKMFTMGRQAQKDLFRAGREGSLDVLLKDLREAMRKTIDQMEVPSSIPLEMPTFH